MSYCPPNLSFQGAFTPVLAKHSKSFSLVDCISVGIDRTQRNFEPMRKEVEVWQNLRLAKHDVVAPTIIECYARLKTGLNLKHVP
jgi:hypothetical protein